MARLSRQITALTVAINAGMLAADIKNESKPKRDTARRISPPKSPNKTMTGGAKEYTFDIGFGIQCKLIMHRPHQNGRTDYIYDLKCNDEHVIQNQTVNDIKVKSNIPEYHLSKVIDEINNIIDNNVKDESEIVGLTKLRDVLKRKYSEIKEDKKDRIRRVNSFTPKSHNNPSPDPKPFAVIPENSELGGGSKRRRSVRRKCKRGTTRRLRR